MKQLVVKIISNQETAPLHYKMALEAAAIAEEIKSGQFIHVKCSEGPEPLLRRPFSLHKKRDRRIEILYKVVGEGTRLLSRKGPGDALDIIGPLGNGFDTRPTTNDQRPTTILTAGGMGVAPLLALAEELSCRSGALKVLVGAKTKKDILCENDFRKLGAEISIATEDGSRGYKGLVTSVLQKLLTTNDYRLSTIYACGPNAMLKTVAALARKHSMPCQISFEEHMACGIGVCLGCPVRTRVKGQGSRDEYKMVCKDGPVFNSEEIVWE